MLRTISYPSGTLKEVVSYKDGEIEGMRRTFGPAGEPLTVEEWKGGKQEGLTVVFQNGEKVSEIFYKEGRKEGLERRYKSGEILVEEITWQEDVRHGPSTLHLAGQEETEWFFEGKEVSHARYDRLSIPQLR